MDEIKQVPLWLKPHQAVDAVDLYRKTQSPIRGALCANPCGTGKTITGLTVLDMSIRQKMLLQKSVEDVEFLPSLFLVPAATVQQLSRRTGRTSHT